MSGDQKEGISGSIVAGATEYAPEQFGLRSAWACLATQQLLLASISSYILSIQTQFLD
jgi:hypothetical protein